MKPTTTRFRNEADNRAPEYIFKNCEWWRLQEQGTFTYKINEEGKPYKVQETPDVYVLVFTDWKRFCADLKKAAIKHRKQCAHRREYAE